PAFISIHAPRGGSDGEATRKLIQENISIHAPRGGSDAQDSQPQLPAAAFQSTLPVGGATAKMHKLFVYLWREYTIFLPQIGRKGICGVQENKGRRGLASKSGANLPGKAVCLGFAVK
ncbi:MAG: hypothetical protein SO355_01975, partial [Candidatus Faecousia sp.]|nr:hypothetical protein [Candidatus Faecousia sp.]